MTKPVAETAPLHTLGAWGKASDGTYSAPVYEHGTNACVYWAIIEPHELGSVVLQRVSLETAVVGDVVHEALKDTVGKAKGQAEQWVVELMESDVWVKKL